MDDSAIQILNEIRSALGKDVPIVYCINKSDLPKCRDIEVVREQNYISDIFPMFAISAKTGLNVQKSLMELISLIKNNLSPIITTLKEYENDLDGLKKHLKMDNSELRELLYSMEIRGILTLDRENKTFKLSKAAEYFA
ncbi:MAG: hypothetical protein ACTSRZ_04125 [Promethearchaeota archaeon]